MAMEKAIEEIVRSYLRQETELVHIVSKSNFRPSTTHTNRQGVQAQTQTQQTQRSDKQQQQDAQVQVLVQDQGTSTSLQSQSPEKPYGDVGVGQQDAHAHAHAKTEVGPEPDADSEQVQLEHEFLHALYQCLEEKGVLKEVQTFIRQRLVQILKGAWPNLVQTICEPDSHVALALIQDFLCTHKLLFTLSVFTSELVSEDFKFREDFERLRAHEVEKILCELHIPKDSPQISEILKQYFGTSKGQGSWSLLECVINSSACRQTGNSGRPQERPKSAKKTPHQSQIPQAEDGLGLSLSLVEKLKRIDANFDKILTKNGDGHANGNNDESATATDKKIQAMFRELERDKEIQMNDRIQRFKRDEVAKIREEIETLLKFEYLQKEKALISKHEERVAQLQKNFEAQREKLFLEKFRQGQEADAAGGEPSDHIAGNFHQSLLAKYNDLVATSTSTSDQVDVQGFGLKRELERSYLLKEATLRNTIDKLKSENEQLKSNVNASPASVVLPSQSQVLASSKKKESPRSPTPNQHRPPEDKDARAFLQYTVECQAEQISALQRQINEFVVAKAKDTAAEHSPTSPDLAQFLRSSKERFSEIEEETQRVKARMRQLQFQACKLPSPSPSPRSKPSLERIEEILPIPAPISGPQSTRVVEREQEPEPERRVHFSVPASASVPSFDLDFGLEINARAEAEAEQIQSPMRRITVQVSAEATRAEDPDTRNEDADADVPVQEPVVIARKVYLTGALVREKVTSTSSSTSSSSSDEHSRRSANVNAVPVDGNGSDSRGEANAALSVHAQPKTPEPEPEALPGFIPGRRQPLSFEPDLDIDELRLETGKASSTDEDDGLW